MSRWTRLASRFELPRGTASRFLRTLAVTLPLGLDPHVQGAGAPPRATLPPDLFAEQEAVGAIGVVWNEGRVCATVGLRTGPRTPTVGHLLWRPSAGPSLATALALEQLPGTETPKGYEIWTGCALAPRPRAGAALSTLLLDPPAMQGQRRRIDLASGDEGTWSWRLIHPLESTIEVRPAARAADPPAGRRGAEAAAAPAPLVNSNDAG